MNYLGLAFLAANRPYYPYDCTPEEIRSLWLADGELTIHAPVFVDGEPFYDVYYRPGLAIDYIKVNVTLPKWRTV